MTKLIIVRHAEAEGNAALRFHGWTDSRITEKGEEQARLLADRLLSEKPDVVLSSPLRRTRMTVQPFLERSGMPLQIIEDLKEINGGDFEDVPFGELESRFPEAFPLWEHEPHLAQLPNGESMSSFRDRVTSALQHIVETHAGKKVLIVTHGTVIRVWTWLMTGLPFHEVKRIPWCVNTAVTLAEYRDGVLCMTGAPDSAHLHGEEGRADHPAWIEYAKSQGQVDLNEWVTAPQG